MRQALCTILASLLLLEPILLARAAEEPGPQTQEGSSRKSQLMEKLLSIAPHSFVEVRLLDKRKLRGRLGKITDEGFALQVVQRDKIQDVTVKFEEVKSLKVLETKGASAGKIVVYALAGIGALFVGLVIWAASRSD